MRSFLSQRVRLTIGFVAIGVLIGLGLWYRAHGADGLANRAFEIAIAAGVLAWIGAVCEDDIVISSPCPQI